MGIIYYGFANNFFKSQQAASAKVVRSNVGRVSVIELDAEASVDSDSGVDQPPADALPAGALPADPVADASPEMLQRCQGTLGGWCLKFLLQKPIAAKPPPTGNHTCLYNNRCNFVGVCDHMAGWCNCPAGWVGDDCGTRQRRPCSQQHKSEGFEPFDKPLDWSLPGYADVKCAQLCDEDIGRCFCNSTMKYGRVPPALTDPPGTPPSKRGRPMSMHCQPSKDPAGKDIHFGTVDPEALWGANGWCQADNPIPPCPCILDGYCGPNCDDVCETFCPNQCSGHGECNTGFCKCHEGWWGHDCAYRTAGTAWTPGDEEGSKPWLKGLALTPASKDPEPGATRLRPLIYVYELPAIFNSKMLQYRSDHGTCVHRFFKEQNATHMNDDWGYIAESALHEALLQSQHRTLDPEEADFFYMPVYASCYIYPVHGDGDVPFFHSFAGTPRVLAGVNMMMEAHAWVRSHYPYWDRSGGRDHIVLMTHDEGSCWLPAVLRPAILLSHWGRMDRNHTSRTGYPPDDYSVSYSHSTFMPEGHAGKLGDWPCYDPEKDLVIPPMTSALKYRLSPLVGAPARKRDMLAFFKGRTQQGNYRYSWGIRQKMENLTRDNDWWGKHKIWIAETMPPGFEGLDGYTKALASATFCFALPGDGYSPRFEDAMHHGCIPVIIQDNIHLGFESILDMPSFSVRIAEKDMERVPEILSAISPEEVAAKQAALVAVWRRYAYTGFKQYGDMTKKMLQQYAAKRSSEAVDGNGAAAGGEPLSLPHPEKEYPMDEDDGMHTIYAWLYSRIPYTRGPPAAGAAAKGQQQGGEKGSSGAGRQQGGTGASAAVVKGKRQRQKKGANRRARDKEEQ